jgi:hypothetical protein
MCSFYFVLLASSVFFYLPPILSFMFVSVVFLYVPFFSPPFLLLCFLLQNCLVHPPLYNLTCFFPPLSPPVEGGIYRGKGSGSYPTLVQSRGQGRVAEAAFVQSPRAACGAWLPCPFHDGGRP